MKNELKEIIDELHFVRETCRLKVSDEVLFSEACGFLRGQYAAGKRKESPDEPVTIKQFAMLEKHKAKLEKLGYDISQIKTKKGASLVLGKLFDK